jgi:hypothetical protein
MPVESKRRRQISDPLQSKDRYQYAINSVTPHSQVVRAVRDSAWTVSAADNDGINSYKLKKEESQSSKRRHQNPKLKPLESWAILHML